MSQTAGSIVQAGNQLQQTLTGYINAIKIAEPRNLREVIKAAEDEAALSGELFFYRWEVEDKNSGKKSVIQGPSVKLALAALRCFGNAVCLQPRPVVETRDAYIFTSAFIDIQTGVAIERQHRMSKDWTVYGKLDRARKDVIVFEIGQSKANRNVILNGIPEVLIDRMMDAAMSSVRKRIEAKITADGGDPTKLLNGLLKRFSVFGVTLEMLEERYDKPADTFQIEDYVLISGDLKALEKRMETVETLFYEAEPDAAPEGAAASTGDAGAPEGEANVKLGDLSPAAPDSGDDGKVQPKRRPKKKGGSKK